jgi:RNA recognition motif-containing protein
VSVHHVLERLQLRYQRSGQASSLTASALHWAATAGMPSKKSKHVPSVFVRGLAYSVTDEALSALFSAVAPVKRAFVVKDKGTEQKSKGFGFVQL